ncbi:MAG: M20/M25/M40 family metallo-hydrolase [Actinobacteria bacterium]|nr:M20/M25/M40 family metallo-hydrolase [Actinomycetota bacterium]
MPDKLLDQLVEWLRIPSISSGGGDPQDLVRAAEWARNYITAAGGEAEVVAGDVNPLVVGELRAADPDAPTVLIYGHYDVQSADPVEAWTTPPFEPEIRNDRLYARGAADDKGNFFPLLYVACELARRGELEVNVRVLVEGEEEATGDSVVNWVKADERGADVVIVFDSEMLDDSTPAITLGVRGIVTVAVNVRTARGDLHSGLFGGTVLNATHALTQMLDAVLPGPDGKLRAELRAGLVEPAEDERRAWALLPSAAELFEQIGGTPIHETSAETYYEQNWADASIDVNGIAGGDAVQVRTIIPATASAKLSMRLAPNQRAADMGPVLEGLLRAAAPAGADVDISLHGCDPAAFDPADPALRLGADALAEACGAPCALIRSGGSIPVLAAFAERGIPTILSGFTGPDDNFHAPDESFRLESLRLGEASARALYEHLAKLGG